MRISSIACSERLRLSYRVSDNTIPSAAMSAVHRGGRAAPLDARAQRCRPRPAGRPRARPERRRRLPRSWLLLAMWLSFGRAVRRCGFWRGRQPPMSVGCQSRRRLIPSVPRAPGATTSRGPIRLTPSILRLAAADGKVVSGRALTRARPRQPPDECGVSRPLSAGTRNPPGTRVRPRPGAIREGGNISPTATEHHDQLVQPQDTGVDGSKVAT
jgi:hypothetical protein